MRELIDTLVDEGELLEVHERWAREILVGYARLEGQVVGIVAKPAEAQGRIPLRRLLGKAARFIWTCNAFNVPLLFLADVVAKIAVMGPQAAVNAVFYNQVQAIEDEAERAARVEALRREYAQEVDVPAPGVGARGGCGRAARGPASGAGAALSPLREPRAGVAAEAEPRHTGVSGC